MGMPGESIGPDRWCPWPIPGFGRILAPAADDHQARGVREMLELVAGDPRSVFSRPRPPPARR